MKAIEPALQKTYQRTEANWLLANNCSTGPPLGDNQTRRRGLARAGRTRLGTGRAFDWSATAAKARTGLYTITECS